MTQDYYGTKFVTAWPQIKYVNDNGNYPPGNLDGYAVKYPDGYISWSPKAVFEEAYQPITSLSFGHAVVALKAGHKVARSGWNGKGMFLYLVPENVYPAQTKAALEHFGDRVPYGAYIAMKTAQENVVPWLASQTDVLANDWQVID